MGARFFMASTNLDDLERARGPEGAMVYFAVPLAASPIETSSRAQAAVLAIMSVATIIASGMRLRPDEAPLVTMGASFGMMLRPGRLHGQALNEFQEAIEQSDEYRQDPTIWGPERETMEKLMASIPAGEDN